jgi:transposase
MEKAKQKIGNPTKVNHYKFFYGVLYTLRTGISWRDLPEEYSNWHTIYTRYKRMLQLVTTWLLLANYFQPRDKIVKALKSFKRNCPRIK